MLNSDYKPSFLNSESATSEARRHCMSDEDWSRLMHPDDKSAIAAMEALPGFSAIMKWVLSGVLEKIMYGQNIGNALKLGPNQLPEYYTLLTEVCTTLGINNIPELYMEMNPVPNAATFGEKKVFIRMTSGLVESLSPKEVQVVLAHECGHIVFKHVRYLMLANALMMGLHSTIGQIASVATFGGTLALEQCVYRWMRMSEYSSDRVSMLYAGNMQKPLKVMSRLAGGPDALLKNINYEAYLDQAEECERVFSTKDIEGFMQNLSLWNRTHPLTASRAYQLKKFSDTTNFKSVARRIGSLCCPQCGAEMKTDDICENGHFC